MTDRIIQMKGVTKESLIVGLSYKDEPVLSRFEVKGYKNTHNIHLSELGIESGSGMETIQKVLSPNLALKLKENVGIPKVIIVRHLLEHSESISRTLSTLSTWGDENTYFIFEVPDSDIDEIPEEWRISASEANLEEIYATKSEVVEVVHQYEEDVVVFDHQETNPVQTIISHNIDESSVLSLELHPARALDVDLSNNPECRDDLESGYFAIAKNSWAEAAIKFQKIATRMPGDSSVYNNYGLALLQRAIEMAKDDDESNQMMANSQFESAILALREAAKSAPEESTILLNLAHALLVSGRSEKAMKIIHVHNTKHPNSIEGANLEAAALVSLGQSVNAKARLTMFKGDSIVDENLARLL